MSVPVAELKDRLRKALQIRDMKPIELSEKTKIPKSAISQYMSGYTKPKQDRIHLICKALSINEAWLLGYDTPFERTSSEPELTAEEKIIANLKKFNLSEEKEIIENIQIKLVMLNKDGLNKTDDYISDLIDNPKYYNGKFTELNAAHAIPEATEEEKKHDDDIMDDENF